MQTVLVYDCISQHVHLHVPAVAPNNSGYTPFGQCVADGANKASLAALLPNGTPTIVSNLASNDFATLQQLFFGSNPVPAYVSVAQGKGLNLLGLAVGAIPYGADRFILGTNGAGTSYAIRMIPGKIATTALGTVVATLSSAKAAYDLGSYVAGILTCAVVGK
jgi:hypothetical protein